MMRCTMCGREITNQDANYCDYCGTALGDAAYREIQPEQPATAAEAPKEERVSTWLFLGVMCLQFIPMVGLFAYLGVLFYWGFATSITDSRKSFARAALIYTAITFVFAIMVLGVLVSSVMSGLTGWL